MKRLSFLAIFFLFSTMFAISEVNYHDNFYNKVLPYFNAEGNQGSFKGVDNVKISYISFLANNERGAIVVLPGKSESYIKYAEFAYDLRDSGYSIYIMDLRGMGLSGRMLSDPMPVYVKHYKDYVKDAKKFIDTVVNATPHKKVFLLSHSTGGLVAGLYLEKYHNITAAVFSAPLFQMDTGKYPEFVAYLGAASETLLGKGSHYAFGQGPRKMEDSIKDSTVTHSEARWRIWEEDLLQKLYPQATTGGATFRWIKECIQGTWSVKCHARKIKTPMLIFQDEFDEFVKAKGEEKVCKRAKDCEIVKFKGSKHEILQEIDPIRNKAINTMLDFFDAH